MEPKVPPDVAEDVIEKLRGLLKTTAITTCWGGVGSIEDRKMA